MTNAVYYDQFKTRVCVAEHIGVSFDNPTLWDWKSQELYGTDFDLLSHIVKEDKVKDDVKQAFLAYLFFINSNDKKHSQLKKTAANDHAKGDGEAFPSSCHAALTLMNDSLSHWSSRLLFQFHPRGQHLLKSSKRVLEFREAAMNAVIIRSTLPTRSAKTVVRRAIPQNVALRRKARQRRVLMM